MTTPEKTAVASHVAIILLCGVVAICVVALVNTLDRTLDGVNASLKTINTPKSGTLSMLDDTILQGRLTIDATNKVLIHEQNQLSTLDTDVATLSSHADATLTALTGTANSASDSLKVIVGGATTTLKGVDVAVGDTDSAIKGLFPVESDTDRLVKDFDAQVTSPDLNRAVKGVADTSQQLALTGVQITAIATDIHKEADSVTAPQPWYKKLLNYGNMGVNIACLATHSCPF